jgi:succinate dehydrogenase/fumarate reductase cytochrome b subunit
MTGSSGCVELIVRMYWEQSMGSKYIILSIVQQKTKTRSWCSGYHSRFGCQSGVREIPGSNPGDRLLFGFLCPLFFRFFFAIRILTSTATQVIVPVGARRSLAQSNKSRLYNLLVLTYHTAVDIWNLYRLTWTQCHLDQTFALALRASAVRPVSQSARLVNPHKTRCERFIPTRPA